MTRARVRLEIARMTNPAVHTTRRMRWTLRIPFYRQSALEPTATEERPTDAEEAGAPDDTDNL
jgi:hypothetical protein